MIWLWLVIGVVGLILALKIILKTLKIAIFLALIAMGLTLLWLWQQGFIFKP